MKRLFVECLGMVVLFFISFSAGAATTASKTVTWSLPVDWEDGVAYDVREVKVGGQGQETCVDIHGSELNRRYGFGNVGEPDLPTITFNVDIPTGGSFVSADVAEVEWVPVEVKVRGEGEQRKFLPLPIAELVRYGEELVYPTPNAEAYEGVYPSAFVAAGNPGICRGVTKMPIVVTPFKWDGSTKTLYKASKLKVRVELKVKRTLRLTTSSATASSGNHGQVIIVTPSAFVSHWNGYAAFRKSTEAGKNFDFIVKNTADIYSDAKYWTAQCEATKGVERDDNADALAIHHYLEDVYDATKEQYIILGAAPTKYQYDRASMIPARYVVNGGSYGGMVCDMYYGCMDRKNASGAVVTDDSAEVWDCNLDGYYMGAKTSGGYSNDATKCVDWTMDVPVTRVPMMRKYVETLSGTRYEETADDIMNHFTNNIAYAENPATWTPEKRWRHVLGGGYLFNYYDRGSDDDLVQGEREFFDGGLNHFDKDHKSPAPDAEACPRSRNYEYYTRYRSARLAMINTGGYYNKTFDELYQGNGDLFNCQSHGLQRGADPGRTYGALVATGIWRIYNMALPCDTGWYDYCPGGSYGITNCCSMGEAPLLCFNDHAGALATFNNSRYAYWGGYGGASSRMEGLIDQCLYEKEMNVGQTCLYMHNNCGYADGSQGGWVNLEVIVHGDPLAKLSPQYSRTWNASTANYTWSTAAAGWAIDGMSGDQTMDYTKDLAVNVSGKGDKTFTVVDNGEDTDLAAARFTLAGDKGQTITLAGDGKFRTTDATVVTNANLKWNVAGGAGRNGIAFVGEACDLTFEGNAERYVGYKVKNVRNLNVSGLNVTFDSDKNMKEDSEFTVQNFSFIGSNDVATDGADGDYNVIRQRVQGFFANTRTIPVANSRLELQTYNIGGGDDILWQSPLFYLTNAYLRVSYNPYWGTEYFVRPMYLNNGHIVGAYEKFGLGRPGSGSAASKGYDLYVWGNSSIEGDTPILVTGELRVHLMDASAVLTISNPLSDGYDGAAGSLRVMGAGKVIVTGQTTFAGGISVEDTAKLELALAKAVKCDVDVAANCELHLDVIPQEGVRTITLASGSKTYLAAPTGDGIYQMVDPAVSSVESASGAIFYDAGKPTTPLSGEVSEGYFILSDGLRKWNGTTGTWKNDITITSCWRDGNNAPAGFTNSMPVVFGVQSGGSSATVTVTGEVKPGFVSFNNAGFPYTFGGTGTISFESLSSGYDVTFNAAVNFGSIFKVRGGLATASSSVCSPKIEVSNGGKLHLTDTGTVTEPTQKIKALKFSFSAAMKNGEKAAVQELRLFRDDGTGYDEFVPLPIGTVIEDIAGQKIEIIYVDGYAHEHDWLSDKPSSENESLKALVDGTTSGGNKWWAGSSTAPTWFTITFPEPINPITGYSLCTADAGSVNRNPKSWTVMSSTDGKEFSQVASVADFSSTQSSYWLGGGDGTTPAFDIDNSVGTLTVKDGGTLYLDGTVSYDLVLDAGSTLAVTNEYWLQVNNSAELQLPDEGCVWVDTTEAKTSSTEYPIIYGANLSSEDLAKFRCVSDTAVLRLADGNLYVITSGVKKSPYTATMTATTGSASWNGLTWKDASNTSFTWNNDTACSSDGEATLNFNWASGKATTLNLNVAGYLAKLNVAGSATDAITLAWASKLVPNTLVFSNYAGSVTLDYGTGNAYALGSANFVAGHGTDIPAASTGTLYIGPGMRALVPEWDYAKVTGSGTLAIKRATRDTAVDKATWANDNPVTGTNELYCGTWEIKNTSDYPKSKEVRVGANGLLKFTTVNDATGYSTYTTGLTIADGGEVNVAMRDTFNRKMTLENGGKLTFTRDVSDSGRVYDFYTSASLDVIGATPSFIGGSAATADSDTQDPIVASGIVALRRDGFSVTVADGATLNVFAQWGDTSSKANAWVKQGGGVMSLHRTTDLTGTLTISAGAVRLVNKGQATKGSIVNQGELQLLASNNYEQTVANAISGAGGLRKLGPGTSVLTAANAYTGATAVDAGTLAFSGSGTLGTGLVTVQSGATIRLGTYRPTNSFDTTSQGTISVTLTAAEKTQYTAGTLAINLACNGTAAGAFGGSVTLYDTDGTTALVGEASVVEVGGVYKLQIRKGVALDEMYHNTLSANDENVKVMRGTYGTSIVVPAVGYYATTNTALTTLTKTTGNTYADIIKNGTYLDTHTVVGWFKVGELPTGSNLTTIYLAKSGNTSDNGYKVAVDASGKILVGKTNYDGGNYSWKGSNYKTTDEAVVAADTWFHLAIAITKTDSATTVTPAVFVNGASVAIASGTFAGNLNGNSCSDLMIGAGVTAAGIYVDRTALGDAAKIASLATDGNYLVEGQQEMPDPSATHYSATVSGTGNWSALSWSPVRPSAGFPDDVEFVLTNTAADATVTIDENIDASLVKVVAVAGKALTLTLGSGKTATADAYDFADAVGTVTLGFAPGTATIASGTGTILNESGTGAITIGANKILTVKSGTVAELTTTNNGTLNFDGGTSASPIVYNANGGSGANLGAFTLASGAYLKVTPNNNKIYNVTGADDGTATLEIARDSGTGTANGSQFRHLTLVANVGPDGFWIERVGSFDASVDVVANQAITLYGNDQAIGSLSGSGAISRYGNSALRTLTITPSEDSEFSGSSPHSFVIAASDYTQTLSGSYTGALTVNANGKAVLSGSANPSSITDNGTLTLGTLRPTSTFAVASTGTLNLTLASDEKTQYAAGTLAINLTCNGTAEGDFGGTVNVYDTDGTTVLAAEASIVNVSGSYKLQIRSAPMPLEPPYHGTVTTDVDWTAANWVDSSATPRSVASEDWDETVDASITFASGTATITADRDLSIGTLAVTNDGTQLTIFGGSHAIAASTIDDTDSTGKTVIGFATSAAITAGGDTVLNAANGNTLTLASGKKLTVRSGTVSETATTNGGTLNFDGGTSASPIVYNANGGNGANLGAFTLASGAYLKVTPNNNKLYNVTGADDGTSTLEVARDSGTGTTDGSLFRNLTLVANAGGDGFWIQVANSFDATVDVVAQRTITLYGNDQTIGSLSGSGAISRYSGSALRTLTITPSEDSEFSGSSPHSFVIAASDYTQTLSGSFTGALTVHGKAVLSGSANPGSVSLDGALKTEGDHTLSSGSNKIFADGSLEVVSGTLTYNSGENGNGICGTLTIDAGATFVNSRTSDALNYGGSPTVNVKGTLSMGTTRWTMGSNCKLNLYPGCSVTGAGQSTSGAIDFYQANTNFKVVDNGETDDVTFSAALRFRDNGNATLNVEAPVTVNLSGTVYGGKTFTITGVAGAEVAVSSASIAPPIVLSGAARMTLPAGRMTTALSLSSNAAVLNITGEEGLDEYVITSGTFTQGEGTVQLNGATLPTADYAVSDNKIVKVTPPEPTPIEAAKLEINFFTPSNNFLGVEYILGDFTWTNVVAMVNESNYWRNANATAVDSQNNSVLVYCTPSGKAHSLIAGGKGLNPNANLKTSSQYWKITIPLDIPEGYSYTLQGALPEIITLTSGCGTQNNPQYFSAEIDIITGTTTNTTGRIGSSSAIHLTNVNTVKGAFGETLVLTGANTLTLKMWHDSEDAGNAGVYTGAVGVELYAPVEYPDLYWNGEGWTNAVGAVVTPTADNLLHTKAGDVVSYTNAAVVGTFMGAGTVKLMNANTGTSASLSSLVTDDNFSDDFTGTLWLAAGRFEANVAVKSNVTIKVTNGAQLSAGGGSAWNNHFILSGDGWTAESQYAVSKCALRLEADLGSSATLEFVKEGDVLPAIGSHSAARSIAATLVGAEGFRVRTGGTLTFTGGEAQTAQLGGTLTIESGSIDGLTVVGALAIAGTGSFGTITLGKDAVLDIAQMTGLTLAGTGSVKARLTAEYAPNDEVTLFTAAAESAVALAELKDMNGAVISSSRYTFANGVVTFNAPEAAVGTTLYFALNDALDAVPADGTVTLCTNVTMTAAYALDKNVTLDGGVYEIDGSGFTGSGTLTISSGYISVLELPSSYSLIGGKYKNDGWNLTSGYRYADLAELTAYGDYVKQVVVGEEGKTGEQVYPVSTEGSTTTYEGELAFTKEELVEKGVIASTSATDSEVTSALNTKQANDLLGWENAVLGLDGNETAYRDIPVVQPIQTDDPDTLKIGLGNVTVDTKSGAKVQYKVKITNDGVVTETALKDYDQPFELDLPESGVSYYTFNIVITPAK